MVNWDIWRNGRCYSRTVTDRDSTAEQAIEQWRADMLFRSGEQTLHAVTDGAEIRATRYVTNRLDRYGTRRGG